MKKFLLSLALVAGISTAHAETYTLVMGDQWGNTDADLTTWTQQGITFTPSVGQNPSSKVPVYKKKNQEVRFYALNTVTISVPADSKPITQLVFSLSSQGIDEQAVITASTGTIATQTVGSSSITWSGSSQSVTFTVGATNSLHPEGIVDGSGQFDFIKVDVATGESTITKPADNYTTYFMCNAANTNGVLSNWTQGNLSFSAAKGADDTANDPALKNGEEARFYVGNTLTIKSIDNNKLKTIEFILSDQGLVQQANIAVSSGTMTQAKGVNPKWTGLASELKLTVGTNDYGTDDTKKGQFDFTKIIVSYENEAGLEEIIGTTGAIEYYTIDGRKVSEPTHGIYIMRQGNKITKIIR